MTVLELGSGMGFFTLDLARLVGTSGRVIALDIQPKMLERMKRRADKAGLLDRVNARIVLSDSMDIADLESSVDFTLAFAVVHEFPDPSRFFAEVGAASKSGASLLLSEPEGHVKVSDFDAEIEAASQARFDVIDHPSIRGCRAALLKKR
jgi:ubiquinone/menaquinone biosynthesis C-methylase UbiE